MTGVTVNGLTKQGQDFNSELGRGHWRFKVRKPYSESGVLFKPVRNLRVLDVEVPYLALDPGPEIQTLPLFVLISSCRYCTAFRLERGRQELRCRVAEVITLAPEVSVHIFEPRRENVGQVRFNTYAVLHQPSGCTSCSTSCRDSGIIETRWQTPRMKVNAELIFFIEWKDVVSSW